MTTFPKMSTKGLGVTLMLIVVVFWLLPVFILIMNGFKTPVEFSTTSKLALPQSFNFFDNAVRAWQQGLGPGFINSLIYGLVGATGAVLLAAFAAFGIVKLRIPRALFWFLLIYSGTVFPFQMYLLPLFDAYLRLGIYDTRVGLIGFYIAIAIPFAIFVMRGFFLTVPWEYQEAASIEGATSWQIFWRIMFPLARAPLLMLILVQFTWIWNDLVFGLVLSRSTSVRPINVALAGMQGLYGQSDGPSIIAATLIASAPTLLLFLLLQRYFIRGLTLGAVGE
jgi:multiple sugar transport system permease protein